MPRIRAIKHEYFTNESLAKRSPEARLLGIVLSTLADREGRLEDRPEKIRAMAFPYHPQLDVDALLQELVDAEFIQRFVTEKRRFIQIINFSLHQRPHRQEPASKIPSPEEASAPRKRKSVVYCLQAGLGGLIKIGYTRDIVARMVELQTGCPHRLILLGTMIGGRAEEKVLHERFSHLKRDSGEWFDCDPELIAFVDTELALVNNPVDSAWKSCDKPPGNGEQVIGNGKRVMGQEKPRRSPVYRVPPAFMLEITDEDVLWCEQYAPHVPDRKRATLKWYEKQCANPSRGKGEDEWKASWRGYMMNYSDGEQARHPEGNGKTYPQSSNVDYSMANVNAAYERALAEEANEERSN